MPKLLVPQRRILAVVALAALFLASPLIIAQQSTPQQSSAPQAAPGQQPASPGQKPDAQKSDDSQEPTEILKVNVNVVQLFFNVKDKHGALIPNLTKDDFEVHEDGTPQTVKYFTAETNLPDRKSTRLNSSHLVISYAVLCLYKSGSGSGWGCRCWVWRYRVLRARSPPRARCGIVGLPMSM